MKQTELLSLRSEVEAIRLSNLIQTISRRHFNEFWTSGNDIDVEGAWRWAGDTEGRGVPSFGWTEQSFSSIEENCLVWVVELVAGQETDGWHPASCCNMHQFICSRPLWCDTNIEKYIKSVTSDYHHPQLRMMWQIVERVFQIISCRLWWLECNVSQLKSDDGLYQEKYQKFRDGIPLEDFLGVNRWQLIELHFRKMFCWRSWTGATQRHKPIQFYQVSSHQLSV